MYILSEMEHSYVGIVYVNVRYIKAVVAGVDV